MHAQRLLKRRVTIMALMVALLGCRSSPNNSDRDDLAFRDRVLTILASEYPNHTFAPGNDADVILLGEAEFGLQNIRARFNASPQTDADLRDLVKHYFDVGLAAIASTEETTINWNAAQSRLRPQLTPAEYLDRMPLAHKTFANAVLQTLVLDSDGTYQYVLVDDLERWGVSFDDATAVALTNLHQASKDIGFASTDGPDKFLALETGDSYDAARILVPQFREFAAQQLGSPFFVAVPNRDFLIMWSKGASQEFQEHMRNNVSEDFAEQPYPLTGVVLEASPAGVSELRR